MKVQTETTSKQEWIACIEQRLHKDKELHPLEWAQRALGEYPGDGVLLELAAFAALLEERPDIGLRYLKRLTKRYLPLPSMQAGQAIALAQQGRWSLAQNLLEKYQIDLWPSAALFPPGLDRRWGRKWLMRISRWKPPGTARPRKTVASTRAPAKAGADLNGETAGPAPSPSAPGSSLIVKPLPVFPAGITVTFLMPDESRYSPIDWPGDGSVQDFLLRLDFTRLSLLRGFDDLFCLSQLQGVDHYSYQVETVRKVLKQFRGRVLLADEVGLGKTIEAGMVIKEYLLRGMVKRVLILTPASLVGQWREEMETKFKVDFATTEDPLLYRDCAAFWSQPRIIASIATARREAHFEMLAGQLVDLVVVDEAHHLKNRASKNWKLVDALPKRFLLLLSATPVQNNLIELYNLLTLLKPGIFKTEREFRSLYMTPGNPRLPTHRERLQELMRDVMIRNTRALADVSLPPRQAATLLVEPSWEEQAGYLELSRLIRTLPADWATHHHLALHYLLESAGSSPRAALAALQRFLRSEPPGEWEQLAQRYEGLSEGAKTRMLVDLLERNPSEKKMVFVRFRETLNLLDWIFRQRGISFARFDGSLSGPEKDAAIERFHSEAPVLLSTESGGEGRNLQFCNTLINFDLPWNPQIIEQRIGRLHRIGQRREVFVFNLATRNTVEEQVLRILDEKINMFQLVVGEVQSILGEMQEDRDFAQLVFSAWVEKTEENRQSAFEQLGRRLAEARQQYEEAKVLDSELFGQEFEAL